FRGPNNAGTPEDSSLPTEWSAEKNVQWKIEIPGAAWSCPIVWGDKIFVTTATTEKLVKPKAGGFGGFGPGAGPPPGGRRPGGDGPPGRGGAPGRGGFGPGRMGPGTMGSVGPPPDVVYRWEIHCLDRATGKELWKQLAAERKPAIPTHPTNTYA